MELNALRPNYGQSEMIGLCIVDSTCFAIAKALLSKPLISSAEVGAIANEVLAKASLPRLELGEIRRQLGLLEWVGMVERNSEEYRLTEVGHVAAKEATTPWKPFSPRKGKLVSRDHHLQGVSDWAFLNSSSTAISGS